ncbi:MAG TPA: phosphomannomutase/phosphoglucomutase [Xanthomonadales bacterium]|nr:phosphomannomutase/phosphoglucomutase [Xanthomonadales bacterium]
MNENTTKLDELKLLLEKKLGSMGEMRVSSPVLALMALLGLAMVLSGIWFSFKDLSGVRAFKRTTEQSEQSITQLSGIASQLQELVNDPQLQALALQALEDEQKLDEVRAFAAGKVAEVKDAQVYGTDLETLDPLSLGDNGFALLEMLSQASEGTNPPLQIHGSLKPPMLVEMAALKQDDEIRGYVVLLVEPSFVLDRFNPDVSGSYLKLTQYNGRQPATELKKIGSESRTELSPQRMPVAGTLFRIEMPMAAYTNFLGTGTLLLMLIVGGLLLAAAVFFYRANRNWELERLARKLAENERAYQERLQMGGGQEEDARFDEDEPEVEGSEKTPESVAKRPAVSPPPEPPPMRLRYDLADRIPSTRSGSNVVELKEEIFRAYDIRGIVGKTLDAGIANMVGQVLGSMALEKDAGPVVVARDGRLSGPDLAQGMIEGITSTGCNVLDIGMVPTGVLYYAAFEHAKGTGVMITGSHNPPDYNGLKIMLAGDTLFGDQIKEIYHRITRNEVAHGEGEVEKKDVLGAYRERIAGDIQLERPLRVVIDCGNGVGGVCAADVLRDIGADVLPMYDEVDGRFPNHHPDPSDPKNLKDLIESVRLMNADIGLALDGDADRLGVVTLGGNIIYPDRVMMLLALDVLDRVPGATIVYDVKCTGHLPKVIEEAGGKAIMYKTGHSLIKAYMKKIGSPFAGEMSGHFFFGERWYGVDDGIYAAARLLEILASTETPPEALLNSLPSSYSTPELKVEMSEGENHAFMDIMQADARFDGAKVSTIDGVRADFADGWGLVRASNTTPILVVRFDGETEEALLRIKNIFRARMLAINPDLDLPF